MVPLLLATLLLLSVVPSWSTRLLDVDLGERVRHFFIESSQYFDIQQQDGPAIPFLSLCAERELVPPFPQFLCPLLFLLTRENQMGTKKLYSNTSMAMAEIHNETKHYCNHSHQESCIVVFLPNDHILLGCANLESAPLERALTTAEDFRFDFIVSHNVSTGGSCEYDDNDKPICSLDSVFVEAYILSEQHSCCCPSGYCATVMIDQPQSITPFVQLVVDLEEINFSKLRRKRRTVGEHRTNQLKARVPTDWTDMPASSASLPVFGLTLACFIIFVILMLAMIAISHMDGDQGEGYGLKKPEEIKKSDNS